MAWQKNYTDEFGENYPQSYWNVEQYNTAKRSGIGQIIFNCYEDASKKKTGRVIAQKIYTITPEIMNQFFMPSLIQPAGVDNTRQAYAMSLAVLDTDSGSVDENGHTVNISFFADAIDTDAVH